MATGWDYATKIAEQTSGTGLYIKLDKDGSKVVGAFVGDPHVEEVIFNQATNRTEAFTADHAAEGKRPSIRFSFNFLVIGSNGNDVEPSMKIYQCNSRTFKTIAKVREKYGTDNWFFEIERKGEKGSTDTTYTVLPEKQIPEEIKAKLVKAIAANETGRAAPDAAYQIHTLGTKPSREEAASPRTAAASHASDDGASAKLNAILERLKSQPRDDVNRFLDRFGITRVKDLKPSDISSALDFITALEGKTRSQLSDPFAD